GFGKSAECILNHETGYARTRVEDGKDEQSLEHDGEVIPERHDRGASETLREDVRHAYRECGSAAGTIEQSLLADRMGQGLHISGGHGKSPRRDGRGRGGCGLSDDARGTVDRKVDTRLQYARSDDSHDCDRGLRHHGAVA